MKQLEAEREGGEEGLKQQIAELEVRYMYMYINVVAKSVKDLMVSAAGSVGSWQRT